MHEHTNHTHPSIPGQMWKALSQQEKDKYKEGLTPLPASGRGGAHAWARTSTLTEAASTPDDALVNIAPARPASHPGRPRHPQIRAGRVHPPLPETPAPSTTPATTPHAVPPAAPFSALRISPPDLSAQGSTASSSSFAGRSRPSKFLAGATVPATTPAGFLWAVLVDWRGGQGTTKQHARAGPSSASATSSPTYAQHCFDSFEESEGIATPVPPPPRAAPSAAPPTAPPAVLPPLPTDLAQMFGEREPPGLGAPLAAPLDAPADSSSSFLERQQLAEALDEQMTGVEAVEVS